MAQNMTSETDINNHLLETELILSAYSLISIQTSGRWL